MEAEEDRRVSARAMMDLDALVAFEGTMQTYPVRVRNLSPGGAMFSTTHEVKLQQKVRLLLHTHQGSWCPIEGRVVSIASGEVNLQFLRLGTAAVSVLTTLLSSGSPSHDAHAHH